MQHFADVVDGMVRAVETIPDGLTPGKTIFTPAHAARLIAIPAGVGVAPGWRFSGSAFSPPAVDLAALRAALTSHAGRIAARALGPLYGDPVHAAGFAAFHATSGAAAAAFAAAHCANPAAFPGLVAALAAARVSLSTALMKLGASAAAAQDIPALAAALAAFEAAIGAAVEAVNAAGPAERLAAPAAIAIVGLNA